MSVLQQPSNEQQHILDHLYEDSNLVVDAVAGSGKTSSIIQIALKMSFKRILVLTYNSRLRKETLERCKSLGIKNIDVHTYHSFCFHHYNGSASKTDEGLYNVIENHPPQLTQFDYDLFCLDEVQDMTPLFFEVFSRIYTNNLTPKIKIAVFGDRNQCIFKYKLADQRFIELTSKIFRKFNDLKWSSVSLSTSYRLTKEMASFINTTMLKSERIHAVRSGEKPIYMICDAFKAFDKLKPFFEKYQASDIFILNTSIKNPILPIRFLENELVRNGYKVHTSLTEDDMVLEEKDMQDKICLSTIHKTKGLERRLVILFGFDQTYFQFYNKEVDPKKCCNELYVATTRAKDQLILIHHQDNHILPFLDERSIQLTCTVPNDVYTPKDVKDDKKKPISVTDLIRHLSYKVLKNCTDDIVRKQIRPPQKAIRIPHQKNGESVSDLTSVSISFMYEYKTKKRVVVMDTLLKKKFEEKHTKRGQRAYNLNNITEYSTPEMLYVANAWDAYTSKFIGRFYQIKDYTWLSRSTMNKCVDRLYSLDISKQCEFEYPMISTELEVDLVGRIDCLDYYNNCVYEFKATQELKDEHYLQLAIYMYLYEKNKEKVDSESTDEYIHKNERLPTRYILYNILTDEKVEISCDLDKMEKHIQHLIYLKNNPEKAKSDEEFLEDCALTTTKYFTTQ